MYPTTLHMYIVNVHFVYRVYRTLKGRTLTVCIQCKCLVFVLYLQDFEGKDIDGLCETLKKLATDSNKYRAKKDRRQQRSSFRDVLRAVEVSILSSLTCGRKSDHFRFILDFVRL